MKLNEFARTSPRADRDQMNERFHAQTVSFRRSRSRPTSDKGRAPTRPHPEGEASQSCFLYRDRSAYKSSGGRDFFRSTAIDSENVGQIARQ
jgi:hypothetical protein